jgi:hypothetical protein
LPKGNGIGMVLEHKIRNSGGNLIGKKKKSNLDEDRCILHIDHKSQDDSYKKVVGDEYPNWCILAFAAKIKRINWLRIDTLKDKIKQIYQSEKMLNNAKKERIP